MKNKQKFLIPGFFVLMLLLNFISAGVSNAGVEYESRILGEFEKSNFVDLIIYLKDISDAEDLISGFSDDEVGRVINRNISNRIAVEMSEEAFFKLIQDNRVESVYYNAPVWAIDNSKKNNFFILFLGITISLVVLIIALIIYKRLKKKRNEK